MSEAALAPLTQPSLRRAGLEVALFAALAGFGLIGWARLFASPPVADLLAALAAACAAGLGLALLARSGVPRRWRVVAAPLIAITGIVAALLAVGLPLRLLGPENWDELGTNVGDGLAGIENADLPYGGTDVWLRLTLLLGAALTVGVAAALAFWPGWQRGRARALALVAVVALYAVATTLDSPGSEHLWGVGLLLLAVAWLWLPEVELGRGTAGLLIALAAGAAALPVAARIDTGKPWWNYESWNLFAEERSVSFNWNHTYGPLEWPQRGTTLLDVESDLPLYWKASVLDRFDGFTWQRASATDLLASAEIDARAIGAPAPRLAERNPEWVLSASFKVRALGSELVIGSGIALAVEGAGDPVQSADGTVLTTAALDRGDAYSIQTYAPQPSPHRLRSAPQRYRAPDFRGGTLVGLPAAQPDGSSGLSPGATVSVPTWGEPAGEVGAPMLASEYADVYRLARRLTASAPTIYDAVRAVELHLQTSYDYSPNIAKHTFPLTSFLFADRSGYCQQFAGSMALMLRMVGIPSRVVSGFAPGRYDEGAYEVRDTDAHSWVEVYFRGIGWVTFDPTPSAAPAAAQTLEAGGPLILRRDGSGAERGNLRSIEEALEGGVVGAVDRGSGVWGPILAVALGVAALAVVLAAVGFAAGRRRLASAGAVELQARELTSALERLGWSLESPATLFGIERRFETTGRRAIAGYAGALRRNRYAHPGTGPPGPRERRRLRRALAAGGGALRWVRALRAVPPGGPSRSRT